MSKRRERWDEMETVLENVRRVLPELAAEFWAAGSRALRARSGPEEMHRFRLVAKRFRYALEVFEPLFGPGLARKVSTLRRMQQLLGAVSDCVAIERAFASIKAADADSATHVRAVLGSRAVECRAEVRRYWRETFGNPGEQERWMNYFRRFAGRTAPRSRP